MAFFVINFPSFEDVGKLTVDGGDVRNMSNFLELPEATISNYMKSTSL
jgi:hypothetical protein